MGCCCFLSVRIFFFFSGAWPGLCDILLDIEIEVGDIEVEVGDIEVGDWTCRLT